MRLRLRRPANGSSLTSMRGRRRGPSTNSRTFGPGHDAELHALELSPAALDAAIRLLETGGEFRREIMEAAGNDAFEARAKRWAEARSLLVNGRSWYC